MIQYQAIKGSGANKKTSQTVAAEMTRLDPKGEGMTARELQLAEAPDDAPLHNEFEWDNEVAGTLYRDEQARGLMRCVELVVKSEPNTPDYRGRAYLAVRADDEEVKVYRPALLVLKDETQAPQIVADAIRQLRGWRERWRSYSEVSNLFAKSIEAIDEELESIKEVN